MYNNFYSPYGYQPKPTQQVYMPEPAFPQNFLKCRPVSSLEEARAAQIDLDGSLFVFTDVANQKIYTKQIKPDGTAALNTYVLAKDEAPPAPNYVTREELDEALAAFRSTLPKAEAATPRAKFNI